MSWIYENRQFYSVKNGLVQARRFFGSWELRVHEVNQACSALNDVWRNALYKHIPKTARIRKILILGLANGSTLSFYRKRFRGCHITAIEWDESMVKFMDETNVFRPGERPDVLIGDAAELLKTIPGQFDLICVDLFTGPDPSPLIDTPNFQHEIVNHLDHYGYVLINTFRSPLIFNGWKNQFILTEQWMTYSNHMYLLRLHGAGTLGDELPNGYERYQANHEYLKREYTNRNTYRLIEAGKNLGLRISFWLVCFEFYRGDHEPILLPDEDFRLVFWYPTSCIDRPRHWWRFPLQLDRGKTGYTVVEKDEPYWQAWSSQARRHRRAWYRQHRYVFCEPLLEEYLKNYALCSLNAGLVKGFSRSIQRKIRNHGTHVRLFGIRDTTTGSLIAGLTTLEIKNISQSIHVSSFILDEARTTPAGTALIEAWFADGQKRGIRFFEFDGFWAPGDPVSWKNYSVFKSQFNVRFIIYPKPLIRWMPRKKYTKTLSTN
ncbi:hypothetical protein IT408_03280 [Candidatus Uhrbacteria bacterium]|nr:hypothetical protein [Candidatus Uhrbacteria bacterium]